MADRENSDKRDDAPSPSPGRRQRAPTITIDTSAVSTAPGSPEDEAHADNTNIDRTVQGDPSSMQPQTAPSIAASVESKESRPTSPHNVSSPTSRTPNDHTFLAVPNSRSRGNSLDSVADDNAASSVGGDTYVNTTTSNGSDDKAISTHDSREATELVSAEEALRADPGTEDLFTVENNPTAFSPGQLGKLLDPKNLSAFYALGGIAGLERGLRTDRLSGLSVDEHGLEGSITFEEAVAAATDPSPSDATKVDMSKTDFKRSATDGTGHAHLDDSSFSDRRRVFGENRLPEKKAKSIWQLAWMAYNDKVLILLTIAAVISLALGLYQTFGIKRGPDEPPSLEWVEGVAISVAIIIVVVVGALNDWQKERQFVKLNKKKDDRSIKVVRSGKTQEISVYDVLVGDVCMLEPGDMVPVDGVFIQGHNVKCDESSATGESDVLKKVAADEVYRILDAKEPAKKLDPFILSGAKVAEGVGSFLVTAVGENSTYGRTMMSLQDEDEVTPLQSKLNVLAEYIAKLGGGSALLLFFVLLIEFCVALRHNNGSPAEKGQEFLHIFIVAVTVIVVAVPEGLPLAVTLALAFATTRMLKDNNLVRILRSCETMGNATTICSDKTGTLTTNKMTVVAGGLGSSTRFGDRKAADQNAVEANGESAISEKNFESPIASSDEMSVSEFANSVSQDMKSLLMQSIVINSTAFEGEEDGKASFIGSKTETAMLQFARDHLGMGPVSTERANATIVQLVPFDSGRKCMAAVVKLDNGNYRMFVKGASEILLAKCTRTVAEHAKQIEDVELSNKARGVINDQIVEYATRSLRTIAMLYRDFPQWPPVRARRQPDDPSMANFDDVFNEMIFVGIVGIQDPLRDGVREAVADCQKAGVFVRMVTGDNKLTAEAIAKDANILTPGGVVMEGPVFRTLSRKRMDEVIPKLCVLARSSPEDKRILVKRLKELGETVAVTGDGTNDAPALKTADVGFSMGIAGTEVAKEASAIILMDDNFSSIVKALLWGRAVNDAVRKFLQFQLTVNITAVLLTFVSAVASSDQQSVLTAVQLLWVNLIMDTFAALALATDPPTRGLLDRKPDPKSANLISVTMWKMIIGQAIYQLIVTYTLHFAGPKIVDWDASQLNTVVFNTFVWMQIFNEFNNRRLDNKFNIFEGMHRNYFFIFINVIMIGGQIMIIFVGGRAFSVVHITAVQWGVCLVLGFISIPVGVLVRLFPDAWAAKAVPEFLKRRSKPLLTVNDDRFEWNQGMVDIRDELAFMKTFRGGRLNGLKFKLQHPREVFTAPSINASHSRHSTTPPRTPNQDNEGARSDGELPGSRQSPAPPTPESRTGSRRRSRSRSNSAFGPAAAMAGIIAGSIAGWSPIERRDELGADGDNLKFARGDEKIADKADLEAQTGVSVHPETKEKDSVLVEDAANQSLPLSQNQATTPQFPTGPFSGEPATAQTSEQPGPAPKDGGTS